jgi:hypothetical protein
MQPSVMGLVVCAVLLAVTLLLRQSMLVGLMASLTFGSTAVASLPSLGGSSPLIYTVFCGLLLLTVAARRTVAQDVGAGFSLYPTFWLVTLLMAYAIVSCVFFPRLFAGQTSAFVPTTYGVMEVALAPVSGNISQTGYFVLGGLTFIAVSLLIMRGLPVAEIRRAFFVWIFLHTAMGGIDLLAKLAGVGDILEPIRTANYAMLTEVSQGGFWRIVGAQSEASAFAGISLAAIAFAYVYWRRTGSRLALWLGLALLILLLLSTSSTAYAGLAVLSIPVFWSIARSISRKQLTPADVFVLGTFAMCFLAALTVVLAYPRFFDPFVSLLDTMVLDKMTSDSGQERSYWNYRSLQSVVDTGGLGIGFGSSRASSWPVAFISQLGIVGSLVIGLLLLSVIRESKSFRRNADSETKAVVAATRAAALGGLVSNSMISGTADPGMVFFISLAVITCLQARHAEQGSRHSAGTNAFAV